MVPIMRGFGRVPIMVIMAAAFATSAFGQSVLGDVSGSVQDEHYAVLPNAVITIRNLETGVLRQTTADSTGGFHLVGLSPGGYELTIQLAGFAPHARTIDLTIGEHMEVHARLRVALAIDVDVKPSQPFGMALDDVSGAVFTTKQMDDLPLAGRNFANLALLAPGILANQVASGSSTGIAAAAQTGKDNTFLVDGLTLDDTTMGANRGSLSLDAMREFVVLSNNFSAEFGQASGVVVSIATRSGANDRRGRLFYYHRDQRWDAPSFAASLASPPLQDSSFEQKIGGGFIGGPIQRNRAFYFGSVDHTVVDTEAITTSPMLSTFRPNTASHIPVTQRLPKLLGRIDLVSSSLGMFTVRYRLHQAAMTNSLGAADVGLAAPERTFNATTSYQDLAFLFNSTQGRSRFNEFRLQLAWGGFDRQDSNCQGCWQEDRPSIKLGKLFQVPNGQNEDRVQLADTFTSLISTGHGEHALRAGVDVSVIGVNIRGLADSDGTYTFSTQTRNGTTTNGDSPFNPNDPATFPRQYTQSFGGQRIHLTHQLYAAFVQDRWSPLPNVALNLGLRWDYDHALGVSSEWRDVAPRIDIVWTPFRSHQTSIRAGYGRYFDQVPLTIAAAAEQTDHMIVIQDPGYDPVRRDPFGFNPNRKTDFGPWSTTQLVDLRVPRNDELTIGVQRSGAGGLALSADVVAARGHDLLVTHDLNYPDPLTQRRPNPSVQKIVAVESRGNSWYRALQVAAERPHTRGFSYLVSYTWSTSERDTEDSSFIPQDQNNFAAERGPAANDIRHRLAAAVDVDLPLGLRFSTVTSAQSALPYTVTLGYDRNQDLNNNDRPDGVGRNSARGGNFRQLDARLSKTFHAARKEIEALIEGFNVTNHANYTSYDGKKSSASFGKPKDALPARQIQAGVRINF